jgi:small-conductance mechanosensitive channel
MEKMLFGNPAAPFLGGATPQQMVTIMEELLKIWLFDPLMGKMIAAFATVVVIIIAVRFLQRSVSRYLQHSVSRYRARKFVAFLGYLAGFAVVLTVFSDRLGGLTVAFGVAGAGIAFALQEVIASVAGWLAVSFGGFYHDRRAGRPIPCRPA